MQLLALFVANAGPHDMPPQNKHVLGVTSLWMLIPVCHSLANARYVPLGTLLACVCAVSTSFWSTAELGSLMHKGDKAVSWAFTLAMLWSTFWHNRQLLALAPFIVVFFLLSDAFFRWEWHVMQLLAHLSFRYVFYVWSHLLLVGDARVLAPVTIGYITHAAVVYFCVDYRHYWASCAGFVVCVTVMQCTSR